SNGFDHGTVAMARASHIVDFAAPRLLIEVPKRVHQIERMNVVSHLFSSVTMHSVGPVPHRALHKIGEKTMKFRGGMGWSCQTAAAKDSDFQAEVPAVLL